MTAFWHGLESVFAAVGALILGGSVITGLSFWLFQTFTSKWLDNRFARELEEFRHKHERELQRLKLEIDALLDRTIKLHSKEFETLPQAWSLLNDAFCAISTASLGIVWGIPDLDEMTASRLESICGMRSCPTR